MESSLQQDVCVTRSRLHSAPMCDQETNNYCETSNDQDDGIVISKSKMLMDLRSKLIASEGKKIELTKRLKLLEDILAQTELRCELYLKEKRELEKELFNARKEAFEASSKLKGESLGPT